MELEAARPKATPACMPHAGHALAQAGPGHAA